MAGMQEKAAKWLHDNRKQLKQIMDQRKIQHQKLPNQEKKDLNSCTYCPKVFFEAEFLVKHVLRRHPEKLVLLHHKLLDSANSENFLPSSDLIKYFKTEFSDLKGEIKEMKQVVSELASTNSCIQEQNLLTTIPPDVMDGHDHVRSADSIPDCSALTECMPNSNKSVEDVPHIDLEAKVRDLFEKYKKDVILKEVKSLVSVNNEEVYEKLRKCLQVELQNTLLYHLDKNSSEWKKDVSKLQHDVIRLTELVTINSNKINSPEALQKLEKKFEQQLQIFLNSSSLYDDDKRRVTKQKSLNQSHRKKKSLYTSNSQSFNQAVETRVPQLQSEVLQFESEVPELQSEVPPLQSEVPQCNKNHRKRRKVNNLKSTVEKEDSKKPNLGDEINYIIDEKFRALNIDPYVQKLTTEEYEKKIHLLKSEKEFQSNSDVRFSEIRNELNSYVDGLAKSKLKAKHRKKLRFSDSLVRHSTPIEEKSVEELSVVQAPVAKEVVSCMSPVEFPGDCYAQGDCLAVVKENSETANTFVVLNDERNSSEPLMNELCDLQSKCDTTSIQNSDDLYGSDTACDNKPPEGVKNICVVNRSSRIFSGSFQNLEDLSDLSSLSDLED